MAFYADKLKQLRKEKGLTQRQLADEIGLGKSAIGMYESGKRTPEFETLEAICDFFNVNMDVLSDAKSPAIPTQSEEDRLATQTETGLKVPSGIAKATLAATATFFPGAAIPATLLAVLATLSVPNLGKVESYAKYLANEKDEEEINPEADE